MIVIVDYGMGNLGSIANMLKKIGGPAQVTDSLEEIEAASKIILPGVGAFDKAMERMNGCGLRSVLEKKALEDRVPFLGICLGMQLLTDRSEEGELSGLGFIPATTRRFRFDGGEKLNVPHMGWNLVRCSEPCDLTRNLPEEPRFYFVHSYYVTVEDQANSILRTTYGDMEFDSGIRSGNIMGVQFHPEKSHKFGLKLLSNFVEM